MKVTEKNDWEFRTYFLGETQLTADNCTQIVFERTDGAVIAAPVDWRREQHSYEDWGRTSHVTSEVPYLVLQQYGTSVKLSEGSFNILSFSTGEPK